MHVRAAINLRFIITAYVYHMKNEIPIHRKDSARAHFQAARMEGAVRNIGINPVKKQKKAALRDRH